MGPIDDMEMGDTKPIVVVSSSSLAANVADEITSSSHQNGATDLTNGSSLAVPSAPPATLPLPVVVPVKQGTGYSSVYLNNRSYNTLIGGIEYVLRSVLSVRLSSIGWHREVLDRCAYEAHDRPLILILLFGLISSSSTSRDPSSSFDRHCVHWTDV